MKKKGEKSTLPQTNNKKSKFFFKKENKILETVYLNRQPWKVFSILSKMILIVFNQAPLPPAYLSTTILCTSFQFSLSLSVPISGFSSWRETPATFTPLHTATIGSWGKISILSLTLFLKNLSFS